ncbi:hypothetical protein [Corynebacterium cystitidis]|uniref:hypothetical protein n=1 Tax=Corynebacterium cystitidis TaxID=35757 RepID=UPI00211E918A|nr:hypothetical protein [Corynebacterium cystitidis]
MAATIDGRIFGSPTPDDEHSRQVTVRIFAKDPDNPYWLLDAHAHATGPLAQRIATDCQHCTIVNATGELTRTSPLPQDQAAGNTTATLALTDVRT